ncbi:helix-turn-helix domain-containing protein [Actinoplanes sp. NPDC049265]|uniref:helix-turn-helix domain-containing protein n=1 Tax=Actinoplanes sp. NPDC049265 TaxID=3363902 RepID=UPI00371F084B
MRAIGPGSPNTAEPAPVGARLAGLRRRAGVTGQDLADRVGMTQSKVSRIETGHVLPNPADVRRIAEELNAPATVVEQLVDDADSERERHVYQRPGRGGLAGRQITTGDFERRSKIIRVLSPTIVVGLLQTDVYAKAMMAPSQQALTKRGKTPPESELIAGVAARLRRRETMLDRPTTVQILLSEAALANRVVDDREMLRQIELVREIAGGGRFTIKILPFARQLPRPPLHGFELIDEKWLLIDHLDDSMIYQDRETIRHYVKEFEELWMAATDDLGPILEDYAGRYRSSAP